MKLSEELQMLAVGSFFVNKATLAAEARALEAEVEDLKKDCADCCNDQAAIAVELADYRDAVAEVRAEAEANINFEDGWGLQERMLAILDKLPKDKT